MHKHKNLEVALHWVSDNLYIGCQKPQDLFSFFSILHYKQVFVMDFNNN